MAEDVVVNLKPLKRFAATIERELQGGKGGPIRNALKQWGARYRGFARERFDKYSKGGGDWDKLAASTKKRRRKAKKGYKGARTFSILRDTGLLLGALSPGFTRKPGQLQKDIPYGIKVGYGGPGRYPGKPVTIADIASFHQKGNPPHLPPRKIIVAPDQRTINAMINDMLRALERLGKSVEGLK